MLLLILSYGLGSIPFGKIIGLRHGIDIQKSGSGNIGFANAVRTLGWKPALPVLIGDTLKGYIPTLIATSYLTQAQTLAVALAAVIGHIFPVWLRLKGGKGIATGLGIMLAITPILIVPTGALYLGAFAVFRKSAPASLLATWSVPILCLIISRNDILLYLLLAVIITWAHRSNIRQMRNAILSAA